MEDVTGFYDALLPRIQAVSGVSAAGVIQMLPLSGLISRIPFTVVGRAFSQEEIPEAEYRIVSSMYLNVMHIPLLAGREFSESDTDQTRLVCHINETLAKRYWPAGDAVDSSSPWREEKVRYRERLGGLVAALASLHGEGDEDDWTFAADAAVTVTGPTDNHTIDNPKGLPAHELYVIIDAALQGDGSRLARVAYQANVLVQDTEPDLDSILLSLGEGEFVPALSVSVTGGPGFILFDLKVTLTGPVPQGNNPFFSVLLESDHLQNNIIFNTAPNETVTITATNPKTNTKRTATINISRNK